MEDSGRVYLRNQNTNHAPHIGKAFRAHIKKKHLKVGTVAHNIHREVNTVRAYYKRHSMQTSILWELSLALKHNFFADIAAQLPAECVVPVNETILEKDKEIAILKQEIERLKADKELLLMVVKH